MTSDKRKWNTDVSKIEQIPGVHRESCVKEPEQYRMVESLEPNLEDILTAADRLKGSCLRTPLIPFYGPVQNKGTKVFLKLEGLQPTGSFKHRGACNAIKSLDPALHSEGVYTSSAGNFGQGLAWNAQRLHVPCSVVVPSTVPRAKVDGLENCGAKIFKVSYDEWWNVMTTKRFAAASGQFIHPVCDASVIAGNATIGLEILEDLPEVNTVVAPFGGGGLSCGIAAAMAAKGRKDVTIFACEVDIAAPLSGSLAAGQPTEVVGHQPSFVDGMGGKTLFPEMWPLARRLLSGVFKLSLQEIVGGIQQLARSGLVVEGAGAAPLVPAAEGRAGDGNVVCVLSGKNIDTEKLTTALNGQVPSP